MAVASACMSGLVRSGHCARVSFAKESVGECCLQAALKEAANAACFLHSHKAEFSLVEAIHLSGVWIFLM